MRIPAVRRLRAVLLFAGILAVSGGCGSRTETRAEDEPVIPPPDSATLRLAGQASYTGYGLRAFQQLARSKGSQNLFFSPVSAGMAFSLAATGATGPTRGELARVLGLPDDPARIDQANAALLRALRANGVQLRVGNSLWAQRGVPFTRAYLSRARSAFQARVETVDFESPSAARRINAWAAKSTAGKIDHVMDDGAVPGGGLVLLNAVYFKGKWEVPFEGGETQPRPFHVNGGAAQSRPTMQLYGGFQLSRLAGVRALRMPYRGGRFAMVVLLPDSGTTLQSVVAGLTPARWHSLTRADTASLVHVELPRFTARGSSSLVGPMQALGARRAFERDQARFGAMLPAEYLARAPAWIGDARQQVFFKVDEEGTEAAAVTEVVVVSDTSTASPEPEPFIVDRPFLAAIVDSATGALLFIGQVYDPRDET